MKMSSPVEKSVKRHLIVGIGICAILIGGLGGWAVTAEISGAVIAPGTLVVRSNVKNVQHPQGGVVGAIHVEDGDMVHAGQVVVRLDDTQIQANLAIVTNSIDETAARMTRLGAEQAGQQTLVFSDELTARKDKPAIRTLIDGETRLFNLRREARSGQKSQLRERVLQFRQEIVGLEGQVEAKAREIALINEELAGLRSLFEKQLVSTMRLKVLERDEARLSGERNRLIASIAQTRGKISETELQIIQIDQEMRSNANQELSDLRLKAIEFRERRVAIMDQLSRVDIRAPQAGMVHQLAIHTVGGVIGPGDSIMQIVPQDEPLIAQSMISPADIDQLYIGQEALIRLSAFNQRETPEISGTVRRISADLEEDQRTGAQFYAIQITIHKTRLKELEPIKLIPGMPVEVFIKSPSRTAFSYLTKPLMDQATRAFREQ
ncbi:HlyD family type I secretion periplasmic adaptor subunit [Hoeflea sp. WL0058]|uniref:Membrane fusion protein (MFP) family protein n=1 Tax=Flavimaribacter sediminis TaxID=2865987 RepID=A0AAE3D017_9HYPH|nr:HlyD family type I secretion periplasmic adaptor subunit [Flavimaribacter sediminis]MBW8636308.1 HlyD family type I secretion periplasmic adaptor subunit [Flavimaribacter sediminis]